MSKKTSIDYARLASWYAWNKHGVILSKTQLQKILYVCYGLYLSEKGERLFEEQPTAWQFGPVFPDVYIWYKPTEPQPMTEAEKETWNKIAYETKLIFAAVDNLCHFSAKHLTEWSHRPQSPWDKVVKRFPFGTEIPDDDIKNFFGGTWYVGL